MSADDQDRLMYGEGPLGGPLDDPDADAAADAPPKRNRAFVYLALAMAGLVLLGVIALAFSLMVWLPQRNQRLSEAATAQVRSATQVALEWTATATLTPTPLPPTATATNVPTQTPEPTPTSTRVVSDDKTMGQTPALTPTSSSGVGGGDKTTPAAGLGSAGLAAIALGLTGLVFVARKLRG